MVEKLKRCEMCEGQRARRICPAINKQICSQCCGKNRKTVIDCPSDCSILARAERYQYDKEIQKILRRNGLINSAESDDEKIIYAIHRGIFIVLHYFNGVTDTEIMSALCMVRERYQMVKTVSKYPLPSGRKLLLIPPDQMDEDTLPDETDERTEDMADLIKEALDEFCEDNYGDFDEVIIECIDRLLDTIGIWANSESENQRYVKYIYDTIRRHFYLTINCEECGGILLDSRYDKPNFKKKGRRKLTHWL
jgi:hypothetical protein